jgi:hypothetical protein
MSKPIQWTRGLFRFWLVASIAWVVVTGAIAYQAVAEWVTHPYWNGDAEQVWGVAVSDECSSDKQINCWVTPGPANVVYIKTTAALAQEWPLILVPPFAALMLGVICRWIVRGFKPPGPA